MSLPAEALAPGLSGRVSRGGTAVLWIHGYTLDARSWGALWALLPGWTHIGVDLPGHGGSAPIDPASSLVELGSRLRALCEAHDVRHVVALSFGTIAALQLLMERRFASAVLAAPAMAGGPTERSMAPVYYKMSMLRAMTGRSPRIAELWLASPAFRGIERRPGLAESVGALVAEHTFDELTNPKSALAMQQPPQSLDAIAGIETPVLLLTGDREMQAYLDTAALLEARLPACRRAVLNDTDHLCLLQSPEAAAPLIAAHLREHAA